MLVVATIFLRFLPNLWSTICLVPLSRILQVGHSIAPSGALLPALLVLTVTAVVAAGCLLLASSAPALAAATASAADRVSVQRSPGEGEGRATL